jgi:hypothetical protein
MNGPESSPQVAPIDFLKLAKAIRFALVAIVLTLAYINLRCCFGIRGFESIFNDMLSGAALPGLTLFVLSWPWLFLGLAVVIPVAAFCTLFSRRIIGSFYLIGCLAIVGIAEAVIVYIAMWSPLIEIIKRMQGGPV